MTPASSASPTATFWLSWCETYWPVKAIGSIHLGMLKGQTIAETSRPAYGQNDGEHMEKNWVWFVQHNRIHFIYQRSPRQIVVEWSGAFVTQHETPGPRWPYGPIRGGTTPIPHEGKLLSFFHSRLSNDLNPNPHRYFIGACLMDPNPPFATVALSRKPVLYGSEVDDLQPAERKTVTAYFPKVVFPLGLVARPGHWLLSLGVNHCECVIAKISPKDLHL